MTILYLFRDPLSILRDRHADRRTEKKKMRERMFFCLRIWYNTARSRFAETDLRVVLHGAQN